MFRRNNQAAQESPNEYATRRDFQQIFTEDMAGLHLLAFLLTADADKAEQCFVAGLEESIDGNPVFRQWARSWSKRAIIKNAIFLMAPAPGQSNPSTEAETAWARNTQNKALIVGVTRLAAFERFVLVMTVLENYSIEECSTLLGRPGPEVIAAKSHALKSLGEPAVTPGPPSGRGGSWLTLLAPTELV